MYLAENLKFLREQNGKTQGELAVLFGIEQKTISSWECGSRKPPIGTIVSLAKLYRVSLDDLVLTDMRPPVPVYALNLAYLRKKYGMTQQELVEIIGLKNKSSISLIENGKYEPSIENLEKLADFFGVTMDQIVKQDLSQEVRHKQEYIYQRERRQVVLQHWYLVKLTEEYVRSLAFSKFTMDLCRTLRDMEKEHSIRNQSAPTDNHIVAVPAL